MHWPHMAAHHRNLLACGISDVRKNILAGMNIESAELVLDYSKTTNFRPVFWSARGVVRRQGVEGV